MVGFRWGGGTRAGPAGWFTALPVALLFFGAMSELIAYFQLKSVLLTLCVLYIIWMALVLFNVVNEAGAIKVIGSGSPASLATGMILESVETGGKWYSPKQVRLSERKRPRSTTISSE